MEQQRKFVVIEINNSFVICHGSGLTWAEAHLLVLSQMLGDVKCTEDDVLEHVKLFELEANDPGLGVSYEYNGDRTTYYILDDVGNGVGE